MPKVKLTVEAINARLKAGKVEVAVLQRGDRLYLQATLPPKPGSTKTRPYQQQLSLGIYANQDGLAQAEARALELGGLIAREKFDWNIYSGVAEPTSVELTCLSLDEFSGHKGHRDLLTTVVDLDQANLIEVINSHKQNDVIAALTTFLPQVRATVEEVSIDMWGGFTRVIETVFPKARITDDRFHVMAHVNEELNQLRRQMHVKFKGVPHLLWKNREELTDEQRQRLDEGLSAYPCLSIAYELKEDLRQIYQRCRTVQGAKAQFQRWLRLSEQLYRNLQS